MKTTTTITVTARGQKETQYEFLLDIDKIVAIIPMKRGCIIDTQGRSYAVAETCATVYKLIKEAEKAEEKKEK